MQPNNVEPKAPLNPRLGAVAGPLNGKTSYLEGTEIFIGRDPSNWICIDSLSVSRRHCVIRRDGSKLVISDLGSLNGTLVAGTRISRRTKLHPGDTVTIGEVTLTVGSSLSAATTPTRPLRVR